MEKSKQRKRKEKERKRKDKRRFSAVMRDKDVTEKKDLSPAPMGEGKDLSPSALMGVEKDFSPSAPIVEKSYESAPMRKKPMWKVVDFTFNDLKALDDYIPPSDFMTLVLPLDAGGSNDNPDIRFSPWYEEPYCPANPWEKWEQEEEEEEQEERQPQHHKEEEGTVYCDFDFDIPDMWANSSARQRRKGRWGCQKAAPCKQGQSPGGGTPISSSSLLAFSLHSTEALDMLEVLNVRLKMCELDDNKEPRYLLFKSEANIDELRLPFILDEPYIYYASRCNRDSTMPCYAHFFPDLRRWITSWVRPTTYEGDIQYLEFFPKLMGATAYDLPSIVLIKPLPVIDFVAELLNRDISAEISLSNTDLLKITEALKGVKVCITDIGNMHETYCVYGLTLQAGRELINRYGANIPLQYNSLPYLQVGDPQMVMPMEFCKIAEGQRYSKHLNQKQMATLQKVGIQHPSEREQGSLQIVNQNKYDEDPHAKEFGIKIEKQLITLEARILPPPWLKFNERGKSKKFLPRFGIWNMICKKMVNGGRVKSWTCINFSRNVGKSTASYFCHELAVRCLATGMDFSICPVLSVRIASPEHLQRELKRLYKGIMNILRPQGRELDLLIVILPDNNSSLYGDLKRICETDIGLVSQCCLAKHVCKMNRQYLANVALKINVKVGGRNTVLLNASERKLPHVWVYANYYIRCSCYPSSFWEGLYSFHCICCCFSRLA